MLSYRIAQCIDPRQGTAKKVLCVCTGNQIRSPTAALVLAIVPYYFNTRSCGVDPGSAVCCIDNVMVQWADEIVVFEEEHKELIVKWFDPLKPIKILGIPDHYTRNQPELIELIKERYNTLT